MRYDARDISFDGILRKEILMTLLDVKHVQKIYKTRFQGNQVEALKDIHFTVEKGDYVAIMGESGSGKSTLLNILAMLDKPTRGQVYLNGTDTATIKNSQASSFRREKLGFVFQDFNLLDTLSVKDNILLPLVLSRKPLTGATPPRSRRADYLLTAAAGRLRALAERDDAVDEAAVLSILAAAWSLTRALADPTGPADPALIGRADTETAQTGTGVETTTAGPHTDARRDQAGKARPAPG